MDGGFNNGYGSSCVHTPLPSSILLMSLQREKCLRFYGDLESKGHEG